MEVITNLIELFLHIDEYLAEIISQYGVWTYALAFPDHFFRNRLWL